MKDYYHVYRTNIWSGKSIAFTSEALKPGEKLIQGGLGSLSTRNVIQMYIPGSLGWNNQPNALSTHTFDSFDPYKLAAYDFYWKHERFPSLRPEGFVVIDHRNEGIREWK